MGDYISREAVINSRHNCKRNCQKCDFAIDGDTWCEGEIWVVDVLRIPTANVMERKTGHWIFHPEQKNIYGGKLIECSECGTSYLVMHPEEEHYCRNCGTYMEQENNQ